MNIKYKVPVGSTIVRHFYCPILEKPIALRTDFTEEEIVFNSNHLKRVDSGHNFSYFRFTVCNHYSNDELLPSQFDVHYSVSAEYIEIEKQLEVA